VIGERCRGVYSLWRLLPKVHSNSENSMCNPIHQAMPKAFTSPHFSAPPYHVRFLLPALLSAPQYNTLLLGLLCHQEQPPNLGKRIRRDLSPDIPPPDQLLRQTVLESEDGVADAIHMPPQHWHSFLTSHFAFSSPEAPGLPLGHGGQAFKWASPGRKRADLIHPKPSEY